MKRVYLDQNKWVDLARARTGHRLGVQFRAAYQAAQTAAAAGRASFPLSAAHYFETHRQSVPEKRVALADTMLLVSRLAAIAPPHVIVPWEVETALIEVFGLSRPAPPPLSVFGSGANYALGTDLVTFSSPVEIGGQRLSPSERACATAFGQAALERLVLGNIGGPDGLRSAVALHGRTTGEQFVAGQHLVRDEIARLGRHRLDDAMTGTALGDIAQPIIAACERLNISPDDVFGAHRDTLHALIEAMPSRWVERELRRARQSNPQSRWESNDLNDVTALSIAVPYCRVVVTERQWAGVINTRKINRRFGTVVTHDLRDLPY
jgi:hypothetical protein